MPTTTIKEVTDYLESIAPKAYQENYDNSGLLTGNKNESVTGVLATLDCIEDVVDEAIETNCNLIVAHHPILFKGIKKLTGDNYIERTLIKAIRNNIAIYAIHTNLDNVQEGVSKKMGEKIGLKNMTVLAPKSGTLFKLTTFIPLESKDKVVDALYNAGAGHVGNYQNCSFQIEGKGTFLSNENAQPVIGQTNQLTEVSEVRVEMILPAHLHGHIVDALKKAHPYEEVAYYVQALENRHQEVGAGVVGELAQPMELMAFLSGLKTTMNVSTIRHTAPVSTKKINRVAVCGGSGSFLLNDAIKAGADVFVSADFKYHEFFDADGKIVIADIGHFESEQFTKDLLVEVLREKFTTFATTFSKTITNPISYL